MREHSKTDKTIFGSGECGFPMDDGSKIFPKLNYPSSESEPLKIGCVTFSLELLAQRYPEVQKFFGEAIITNAYPSTDYPRTIEYTIYHDEFDEIKEGEKIPVYEIIFESGSKKRTIKKLSE